MWILLVFGTLVNSVSPTKVFDYLGSIHDDPELLESLIQTIERSGHATVSSDSRRRTVRDTECDGYTAKVDDIEDACNQYRYSILLSIEPDFTKMLQTNSTNFGRFMNLDSAIHGDPMSTERTSGILRTLLENRIAIYGGVDPISNMTIPGATDQLQVLTGAELTLSKQMSSSLDTLWTSANRTDQTVADILYNQVFQYGSMVDKMIVMMEQAGEGILALNTEQLQDSILHINSELQSLTDEICATQRDLGTQGKNAADLSDSTRSAMNDVLNTLMEKSDQFLDVLDQKSHDADGIIDRLTDGAERIVSQGIDEIEKLSDSFVTNFRASIDKLAHAFSRQASASIEDQQKRLADQIASLSNSTNANINREESSIQSRRASLALDIVNLRKKLSETTTRVRGAVQHQMAQAEDSLSLQRDGAKRSVSGIQESQRSLNMQIDEAGRQVDQNGVELKSDLSKQESNAADSARSLLTASAANLERLRLAMLSSIYNTQASVSSSIQQTSTNLGQSDVTAAQAMGDQSSLIAKSRSVGQANVQLVSDAAGIAISDHLSPLLNSLPQSASDTVQLTDQINQSQARASSDSNAAVTDSQQADQAELRAVSVNGLLTASSLTSEMARTMSSITSSQESSRNDFSDSQMKLTQQDASAATLWSSGASLSDRATSGFSAIESQVAELNDGLANSVDSRIRNQLQVSSNQMNDLDSKSQAMVNHQTQDIASTLLGLIAVLQSNQTHSSVLGSDRSNGLDSLPRELSETLQGLADLMATHDEAVQSFNKTLSVSVKDAAGDVSRYSSQKINFLNSLGAAFGRKLDSLASDAESGLASKIDAIKSMWTSVVSPDFDSQLQALFPQVALSSSIIDDHKTQAEGQLEHEESAVTALGNHVAEVQQATTRRVASLESSLLSLINNSSDGFLKTLKLSPQDLAATFIDAAASARRSITDAVDGVIDHGMQDGEASLEDTVSKEAIEDTHVVESVDSILKNVTSGLNSASDGNSMSVQYGQLQVLDASTYVQLAGEIARRIAQNISEYTLTGKKAMDDALDRARDLSDQVDKAAGWQGRAIEQQIAHSGAASAFAATSDGIEATHLSSSSSTSVSDALASVTSLRDTINVLLGDSSSQADQTRSLVTSAGSDIEKAYHEMNNEKDHQSAALNSSMTIEQKINQLQLSKIRDFTGSVRDAWLRYVDDQNAKFTGMTDSDKTYFSALMKVSSDRFDSGSKSIDSSNRTVSQVSDSLNSETVDFNNFESLIQNHLSTTSKTLDDVVKDSIGLNRSLGEMVWGLRTGMNQTDSTERGSIVSKLQEFEASLDDISNRVVLAVNVSAIPTQ